MCSVILLLFACTGGVSGIIGGDIECSGVVDVRWKPIPVLCGMSALGDRLDLLELLMRDELEALF